MLTINALKSEQTDKFCALAISRRYAPSHLLVLPVLTLRDIASGKHLFSHQLQVVILDSHFPLCYPRS